MKTGSLRNLALISGLIVVAVSVAAAFACGAGFILLPAILLVVGIVLGWRRKLAGFVVLLIVSLPLFFVGGNGLLTNGATFSGDICRSADSLFYTLGTAACLVVLITSAMALVRSKTST